MGRDFRVLPPPPAASENAGGLAGRLGSVVNMVFRENILKCFIRVRVLPERRISSLRAVGGGWGEISGFFRNRRRLFLLGLAGRPGSVANMVFREKHTKMFHQSEGVA